MAAVNPKNLIWAREAAGLSLEEAAKKLNLGDTKKHTAIEKLERLESGEQEPSRAQLSTMSEKYRQPLLAFYLRQPPRKADRGQDFRTLSQPIDPKHSAYLDILLRNLLAAQSLARDLLEEEEARPLPFINSANMSMGYEKVAQSIAKTLQFDLKQFRKKTTYRDAFDYLRDRIESKGIFLLLMSDLGSHHTAIPVEVFRGFAIADPIAPFIVINKKDARSAWSFTALHELAHLWLGASGVSDVWGELAIEKFCNQVAAALLLPPHELNEIAPLQNARFEDAVSVISDFAKKRNISRAMVAYNLRLKGKIDWPRWQKLQKRFTQDRLEQKQAKKEARQSKSGGPNSNVIHRSSLGKPLISLARRSMDAGTLTPSKAGIILGVKLRRVEAILNPAPAGKGA